MSRVAHLQHEFVEYVPDTLDAGVIYVTVHYATAVHLCCCGCGLEVVTPLSPTDWKLIFDGETISLKPSIGNWSFPCRSHYWIRRNTVEWAGNWSDERVEAGRRQAQAAKRRHLAATTGDREDPEARVEKPGDSRAQAPGFWARLWKRLTQSRTP